MGKLNIAHHKSYHPYRLDNVERVRRDEAEAKRKQTEDADRALGADTESRLSSLRARAGITTSPPPSSSPLPPSSSPRDKDTDSITLASSHTHAPSAVASSSGSSVPMFNGHINLFADIEEHASALAARAAKSKPTTTDADRGVALAPTKQDLHPWYSSTRDGNGGSNGNNDDKLAEARRQRDLARQKRADPLASIPSDLKRGTMTPPLPQPHLRSRIQSHTSSPSQQYQPVLPPSAASREGRLARESTERERALALVKRKQRERERAESSIATPSTVHGYTDMFNRREVEDAHRERDRAWRQRRWEEGEDDSRRRGRR
ncbi:hypothetical protein B0F90DRAFT_1760096 [Multifurca ochricompacta]|uniref:CBF1-interacting co-repressor CIR N-terminal domain-containing protein n=1 Tax=Multifurca ochricompacta TaxID=376703 RepID=A0AAD4QKD1_9AGAM|nr:hypothetical protein B0F90DRAFT_1760096 [Multifurca ochricompacta]